ncbi:agmatinase [Flammeovirga yaeyamensis]|uniref:Agmatinase n=1 Tax=Flammeovirga yaeyamensis TaxID=367791 RepID=A0AAX1NA76_9BACT|nr:agmatinase [Flammeovirga yaeyamensis]MBB3701349.1 agmatinase [Flammeovirga yaeyamensis]NMF38583.1 agmatinase [Flammeovirga yaeyamensis]QWG04453.1 agmatinase [Flammeovirga yaeyamensis]
MSNPYIFAGLEEKYSAYSNANILLQPIPYDGTSTWGKGADKGLATFIEASENMELYDIETDSEVYKKGVYVLPEIDENSSPEKVYQAVYKKTKDLLDSGKYLTFFGGEHSISIGVIDAFKEKYENLTVLQIDAHADLRPSYLGSEFNHACALYRASKSTNLIQVGIRSMDVSEKEHMNFDKCYFAEDIYGNYDWMDKSIDQMTDDVYLTIDLDAFDPGIMPATGTPEPGGFDWNTLIIYLKKVFTKKNVVGFDIVEFAPIEGLHGPGFLVSKLYYKLLSYKYYGK